MSDSPEIREVQLRALLSAQGLSAPTIEEMIVAWRREAAPAVGEGHGLVATDGSVVVGGSVYGNVVVNPQHVASGDSAALERSYLLRVIHQTALMPLAAVDPAADAVDRGASLRLDAIYTALLTLSPAEDGDASVQAQVPAAGSLEPTGRSAQDAGGRMATERPRNARPLSAMEQLDRHPWLVLLGEPGSGKSTFLNFVALCLAGELLKRKSAGLDLLTAVPAGSDEQRTREPWSRGALLPVRVVLRDFASRVLGATRGTVTARDLCKFIETDLEEASMGGAAALVERHLRSGSALLLLDGLDEVPEAERRRDQIRQAVEGFSQSYPDCRIVVTSRTYAYRNQGWRLRGFAETALAPFTERQIAHFVGNWYAHAAALGRFDAAGASGRALALEKAILASDRLLVLAQSPLLLTLMASHHAWRGGSLPERREQLYAEAVELLLNTWERRQVIYTESGQPKVLQPSLAEWLKVDSQKVRYALEELAFKVHGSQPELSGTADVRQGDLVDRLLDLSRNADANPTQLVDYLSQRTGLLLARGIGVYTFVHRTFQEYLAACHLTRHGFPTPLADLAREDPNRWREIAQLAAAKVAGGTPESLWSLIEALCHREPDDEENQPMDVWGALLAGQALAGNGDLMLDPIRSWHVPKLERVRRWQMQLIGRRGLVAAERALAGKTLARLGDPRFDPDLWFLPREHGLGFIEIPAGMFHMGSTLRRDPHRLENERRVHVVDLPLFYLARFPVTMDQYRAFLADSGSSTGELATLANHPVVNVDWHAALAYTNWLGEQLRELARSGDAARLTELAPRELWQSLADRTFVATLPSEAEWEKAARAPNGLIFPWGAEPDPELANYAATTIAETTTVGCFPLGASAFGCEEMSGNVWEWTRSAYQPYPYPPPGAERRQREDLSSTATRVVRGGSYGVQADNIRCATRGVEEPGRSLRVLGFRVALSQGVRRR